MDSILYRIKKTILAAIKSKRTSLLLCYFIGVMASIPYYCENLFIFTFMSLFALFYVVITQRRVTNRIFLPFFAFFYGFYFSLYLFLSELYPYDRFGFSESQAGFILICSCILIPLLHATVVSLVMMCAKWFSDDEMSIFGYASLWVISEWVLSLGNLAFPWGNISISLTGALPYLQTASLFGKYFISFLTVSVCCGFVFAIKSKKKLFALISAGVLCLNCITGTVMWLSPIKSDNTIKAAAIQGNVLSNEKWDGAYSSVIFDNYISLCEEAGKNGAKIIVVPESAIPYTFKENGKVHAAFAEIAKKYTTTIITGINYYEKQSHYNSAIGIFPDGTLSERYDKRHLVPFGEFIPLVDLLGELIPFVGEFSADSGAFEEGTNAVVIETEHGTIAPLVCFDSIFSQFSTEAVNDGAEILAIVTNDSWFNDSQGVYTHLRHAQLRAIETGRYVMRAANTGVSAFINEQGEILDLSEVLTTDIVYADVVMINGNTLYSVIGDIFLYISILTTIVLFIYNVTRGKKHGNNSAT